jgi:probable HAF family extracellular repeat protein
LPEVIVGGSLLPGDQLNHPFLWDGEQLTDLTAPPFGESLSGEARWINEAGKVVGGAGLAVPCAGLGSQTHGFLWRNGAMTDLGMIAGSPNSQADFINSKTQIVGGSFSCDGAPIAFLWENGSMVDLNTLISPNSPFFLYWAPFIDDHGEVGAFGVLPDGDSHTVLLIPCDENHAGIEGCDYSMVEAPAAVAQTTPAVRNASSRMLPQSLMRRMNRNRFPGLAIGPRD